MEQITGAQVAAAAQTLQRYKAGKAHLEQRIVRNQQWYKMRHWGQAELPVRAGGEQPASAWLFNSLLNKHADAMDNYPAPAILPRERSDEAAAEALSSILPTILEQNGYEQVYSKKWWAKLKHGTGVEGVFWNPAKADGRGDIEIRAVDLLNLFWEPGVEDIQDSPNLFYTRLVANDLLRGQYPFLEGKLGGRGMELTRYLYDDTVDTSDKTLVVDWYYKRAGKLHFCKFAAGEVLFATENEPAFREKGLYDHGQYPFILDVLFADEGTPAGFGYLDLMKSAQSYIDRLDGALLKGALMAGKKRFFIRTDGSVNEEEFADWDRDFVHVFGGGLGEDSIREIQVAPPGEAYLAALSRKVEELKEVSGNRDFTQGGTAGGVTAASAIAALQEAGSKLSRDMLKGSYDAFCRLNTMVIELIRQFYREPRCFRILGGNGEAAFSDFSADMLHPGWQAGAEVMERRAVFDISVRAQKSSPFARISQNELAKEFYQMGFFQPENAQAALACMDMMDFEGKAAVMEKIRRAAGMQDGAGGQMLENGAPGMAGNAAGEGLTAALAAGANALPGNGRGNLPGAALRDANGGRLALSAGGLPGAAGGLSPQEGLANGQNGAAGASLANALPGNGRGNLPGGMEDISPRGTAAGGAWTGMQAAGRGIALAEAQNAALLAAAPMMGGDPARQAVKQARKRR